MISIEKIIEGKKSIVITGHERPDGDCIGSTLGLYNYIKKLIPSDVSLKVVLDKLGPRYSYLKGYSEITYEYDENAEYDVFFGLDCSTVDRYGKAQSLYNNAKTTVCIDHHISNEGFGDFKYVDGMASSTCEMIYRLIPEEYMDVEIAKCLYSGIISDTGVLQYSNTSPKTLNAVAKLIEYGFDFSEIITTSYYEKTYMQNLLLGRALIESVRFLDERAIFTVVTRRMMEFYNAQPKDLDGIVNQLINTQGVHCAVFLYEISEHEYKVSMRSDDMVDVSKIATYFGGGGHKRAAGCTMQGTYYDVLNNLSEHIEKSFDEWNNSSK